MTSRIRAARLLATTTLGLGVAISAPAWAQQAEVETVIVTASKRAEDIQDVPMSVSAVSGQYLERSGMNNAVELMRTLPSVAITQSNNNRNNTIFIRGIGTSGTNPGIESSVGIFIDGVYILAAGPIQANLHDISTIEVLRGPQGTLYGRNTPVGAINITTREPQARPEAMLNIRAGDYKDRQIAGYFGGAISETLAGRLSIWASERDGYEHNLYTNDDVNGQRQYGIRGRVKWSPSETLTGNLIAYFTRIDAKCCNPETLDAANAIATPGFLAASAAIGRTFRNFDDSDHVIDDDGVGRDVAEAYGASINFDWELGNGFTATSITAFNGYTDDIRRLAADGLPQDTADGKQWLRREGYSQELRIASPAEQRLSYLAGVFLFSEELTSTTATILGTQANRVLPPGLRFLAGDTGLFYYAQDTRSAAVFGQATFRATEVLRLTAGGRYSRDKKDAYMDADVNPRASPASRRVFPVNHLGELSRTESEFTWTLGAQYDIAPSVMAYAIAATGYKTGGYNARAAAAGVPVEFDAENSITYELGIKSTLLDRRLVLNANVYSMTLEDFQEAVLNPVTNTGFIVSNAGDRRVRGVEAEAQFNPIRPLSLRGSIAYMDAEYTDYPAGQCFAGRTPDGSKPGTCNFTGLTPSQSPKWSWSFAGQWQAPLGGSGWEWFAMGDISYIGSRQLEATLGPGSFQESTTVVGARVGVTTEDERWRLSLYGKNLTDEAYFLQKTPQPLAAFISAGGTAAARGYVGWYAPPRTYGVELTMKY